VAATTADTVRGRRSHCSAPHDLGNVGRSETCRPICNPRSTPPPPRSPANQGLSSQEVGSLPATYGWAGACPNSTRSRILPYALGGIGVARLTPPHSSAFSSGVMPDGSTTRRGTRCHPRDRRCGRFTGRRQYRTHRHLAAVFRFRSRITGLLMRGTLRLALRGHDTERGALEHERDGV